METAKTYMKYALCVITIGVVVWIGVMISTGDLDLSYSVKIGNKDDNEHTAVVAPINDNEPRSFLQYSFKKCKKNEITSEMECVEKTNK